MLASRENAADLARCASSSRPGRRPAIDRTYPLAETGAAVPYLQDGRARGKVVVTT